LFSRKITLSNATSSWVSSWRKNTENDRNIKELPAKLWSGTLFRELDRSEFRRSLQPRFNLYLVDSFTLVEHSYHGLASISIPVPNIVLCVLR
jgi:hypothetical protein